MSDPEPIRVMHLITGLGVGGAETMLAKLLGEITGAVVTKAAPHDEGRGNEPDQSLHALLTPAPTRCRTASREFD